MSQLSPPMPPRLATTADDGQQRLQFRLYQLMVSTLTILAAVWVTTYGRPFLTILAWVVAKHVLVAVLMMGLHRYPRYKGEGEPSPGA